MVNIRYERQKRIDSMPVDTEHDLLIKRIVEARISIGREAMRQVFESKDLTALRQNLMDYVTEQGHWLRSSMGHNIYTTTEEGQAICSWWLECNNEELWEVFKRADVWYKYAALQIGVTDLKVGLRDL